MLSSQLRVTGSFNPRAPRGARRCDRRADGCGQAFQSTRPAWGATSSRFCCCSRRSFQSTRPAWGATTQAPAINAMQLVSIHAPRVGRDIGKSALIAMIMVSIHAPRVGRDPFSSFSWIARKSFNPRAPRGARPVPGNRFSLRIWFQSTRPAWGATSMPVEMRKRLTFQSTRPAWGATCGYANPTETIRVSIHAPRVGRDLIADSSLISPQMFQSTRPAWGATLIARRESSTSCGFNPRAPRGARRGNGYWASDSDCVSIHAPRVGRDVSCASIAFNAVVSIHAPRVGRDDPVRPGATAGALFQSTRPAWGATATERTISLAVIVSIHAPRVGRDAYSRT